jgi:antitoxin component YwqK of YwqJK toxin-antitoxin module
MKYKLMFISAISFIACNSDVQIKNGEIKEYYENKKVKSITNYKNDKLNGRHAMFFENGNQEIEENFVNSSYEGVKKEWYENGNLKEESNFKNNKKEGVCKFYYSNGQIQSYATYSDGLSIGDEYEWYDNGVNMKHLHCNDEGTHCIDTNWYDNGKIKQISSWVENHYLNGYYVQYYDNGNKEVEGKYFAGKEIGTWRLYDREGKLLQEDHYDKGKLIKSVSKR